MPDVFASTDRPSRFTRAVLLLAGSLVATHTASAQCVPINVASANEITFPRAPGFSAGQSSIYRLRTVNNQLYAVGTFTEASGALARSVARLRSDDTWEPLNSGYQLFSSLASFAPVVSDITEFQGETLIAGNFVENFGKEPFNGLARWDGVRWRSINANLFRNGSYTTTATPTFEKFQGELIVAGDFSAIQTSTDTISTPGIAAWNGATWRPLGTGLSLSSISTISTMTTYRDRLIVSGRFSSIGGVPANSIAAWDGTSWSEIGQGFDQFTQGTTTPFSILSSVNSLVVFDGKLYAGGYNLRATGTTTTTTGLWVFDESSNSWVDADPSRQIVRTPSGVTIVNVGRDSTSLLVASRLNNDSSSNDATNVYQRTANGWLLRESVPGEIRTFSSIRGQSVWGGVDFLSFASSNPLLRRYVLPAGCPTPCNSIDFNHDELSPDTTDLDDFLSVFSGGPCSTGLCDDTDFNNDDITPDAADVEIFLRVLAGGPCNK
jgi:hypothetical protein